MKKPKNKIITIIGPTASGKTGLAVKLAHKFDGEIISADSRQVYRFMDVGTGKDLREYEFYEKGRKAKIPYHLIDEVHPNTSFDLAKFKRKAERKIEEILEKGKLPIVAGGTGLYAEALVADYNLCTAKTDKKLRKLLENKTIKQLHIQLKSLDEAKFLSLNDSEKGNKQHLVRYTEIALFKKEQKIEPDKESVKSKKMSAKNEFLVLGIARPREEIKARIWTRLYERLEKEDMIGEVERLHRAHKVSWKRLESFGLEYKFIALYLEKKISYEEMVEKLYIAICQFSKRQMSWYRRWERQGREIVWVEGFEEAEKRIIDFLKK